MKRFGNCLKPLRAGEKVRTPNPPETKLLLLKLRGAGPKLRKPPGANTRGPPGTNPLGPLGAKPLGALGALERKPELTRAPPPKLRPPPPMPPRWACNESETNNAIPRAVMDVSRRI